MKIRIIAIETHFSRSEKRFFNVFNIPTASIIIYNSKKNARLFDDCEHSGARGGGMIDAKPLALKLLYESYRTMLRKMNHSVYHLLTIIFIQLNKDKIQW